MSGMGSGIYPGANRNFHIRHTEVIQALFRGAGSDSMERYSIAGEIGVSREPLPVCLHAGSYLINYYHIWTGDSGGERGPFAGGLHGQAWLELAREDSRFDFEHECGATGAPVSWWDRATLFGTLFGTLFSSLLPPLAEAVVTNPNASAT